MNFFDFRKANLKDGKLLSVLFKNVYINTYGTEGITHEFADFIETNFSPFKINQSIENPNFDLWIANFKNNPVGVLKVDYKKSCPINGEIYPEINKLYILRHFFGKGIGQELMRMAECEISKKGFNRIWLWLLESNLRAEDFYTKQGYKNTGTADFKMSLNTYKNIVMSKSL